VFIVDTGFVDLWNGKSRRKFTVDETSVEVKTLGVVLLGGWGFLGIFCDERKRQGARGEATSTRLLVCRVDSMRDERSDKLKGASEASAKKRSR